MPASRVNPQSPLRRRPFTGRALVLVAVLVLLVVLLASPLHRYLSARSALQRAAEQGAQSQQELTELRQQSKQLQDPAYIEEQARIRLRYALPGETVYTVVGAGQPAGLGAPTVAAASASKAPGDTWNSRLWGSVQAADGAK